MHSQSWSVYLPAEAKYECIAWKLASFGYGVIAMDYPGFELSEGLHGYILSFDKLVDEVIEHYSKVKEKPKFCNLPSFLFGESMGGAIALKVHQKQPDAWNDSIVPPWLVTQILIGVAKFLPTKKLHSSNTGFRRVGSQRCKEERICCL
ncbi:hypothetical protein MTR67_010221 [Solanum verrucosum]|uniref:Serine aminopeptidase S33 domain-containing protein n=1 Tax=Solanum verrucosum TaxID=315347 RepID=A0AAF0TF62_SOLVR|nr:hypothetical protein MTR67_010221 [Solanum verrucosum]